MRLECSYNIPSYYIKFYNIQPMGCSDSSAKENIIIEVAYCGSCGWSVPAKKLCDSINKELPSAVIDCRPENEYTGVMKVTLIIDRRDKK